MVKQEWFTIEKNEPLNPEVFSMTLSGNAENLTAPGQFVNAKIDGLFLRRPFSVCDWWENGLEIVYKVVGAGTEKLSSMGPGDRLDLLTGLGNGFSVDAGASAPVLVGGGVGVPPLYGLAKALLKKGIRPAAVLGFNRGEDVILADRFSALDLHVTVLTADGSAGVKGLATEGIQDINADYYYACGPLPMLRAVYDTLSMDGQLSFEERMGCGFGACMGCTCQTKYGPKRLCVDGPVLKKEEVVW